MTSSTTAAARFLMMSTLGADKILIDEVANTGITDWLNDQLDHSLHNNDRFKKKTEEIWQHFRSQFKAKFPLSGPGGINGDGNNPALPYKYYFRMAWWHKTLSKGQNRTASDFEHNADNLVRHRVAQALSEILVISDNSVLELDSVAMADYYDILYRHAFGNYSDMLTEVSLHPCMGVYLSHLNNQKAKPEQNIHPDENYAREIMQLFTIGLFDLNQDGSHKQDSQGNDIPSYDNTDIQTLARVFTGLQGSSYQYEWGAESPSFFPFNGQSVSFSDGTGKQHKTIPFIDMCSPMSVDENYHDRGAKTLLKGRVQLPANQNGKDEIKQLVEQLVAHANTAPFIAKKLIQQLVKSNPSPKYISDVAAQFGTKGNLKAVIKTILLHPEAEQPEKLKSPLLRATQLMRAFKASNTSDRMWLHGERLKDKTQQHVMSSPTVFNFYKPDYSPHGKIEQANKVAPEFELHNSATSIDYINLMYEWLFGDFLPGVSTIVGSLPFAPEFNHQILQARANDVLKLDFNEEVSLSAQSKYDELIDRISLILTGKTNLSIKNKIKQAYASYDYNDQWVVQTVIFMIVISPEFTVLEA